MRVQVREPKNKLQSLKVSLRWYSSIREVDCEAFSRHQPQKLCHVSDRPFTKDSRGIEAPLKADAWRRLENEDYCNDLQFVFHNLQPLRLPGAGGGAFLAPFLARHSGKGSCPP